MSDKNEAVVTEVLKNVKLSDEVVTGLTIDAELIEDSVNPVENQALYAKIKSLQSQIDVLQRLVKTDEAELVVNDINAMENTFVKTVSI